MKRFLTVIFIGALLISTAQGQFAIGVKGGLTMSKINLDMPDELSADIHYGGHAGVFFKFGKGILSFQPEVMFIQKGVQINHKENSDYAKATLNYIDVPLLLRGTLGIKLVEVYINLGPYAGYMISNKGKLSIENDPDKKDFSLQVDNDIDAGIIFGAGIKVLVIVFEIRYGLGLVNVSTDTDTYQDSKNNYLNFTLGVQF